MPLFKRSQATQPSQVGKLSRSGKPRGFRKPRSVLNKSVAKPADAEPLGNGHSAPLPQPELQPETVPQSVPVEQDTLEPPLDDTPTTSQTRIQLSNVDTLTQNEDVKAWLAKHQNTRALVTQTGSVYHVASRTETRTVQQLLQLVEEALGQAQLHAVSLIEYSILRSQLTEQSRSATRTSQNDLMENVLNEAIRRKVSDIYISLQRETCSIHFRTFGRRYEFAMLTRGDGFTLVRALWSLSTSGQFEDDKPTDTAFDWMGYRVRGSSVQDTRGASVVLRLRDPNWILPLSRLGYTPTQLKSIHNLQRVAGGLILVSGETNSGKSTTLTSVMDGLDDSFMIIEIADPVELEFKHITHIGLDHYAGNAVKDLREILGSLVRQNPDVLFIGEVRDEYTSEAAINMTLQGKRVWGTVHAGSCLATLPRLEGLGIPRDVLAQPGFLSGVINQNLVPVVCQSCGLALDELKGEHRDRADEQQPRLQLNQQKNIRYINTDGCNACVRGVAGQTVVAEVLSFLDADTYVLRGMIQQGAYADLEQYLIEQKSYTKRRHAIDKIRAGKLDPLITEAIVGDLSLIKPVNTRLPTLAAEPVKGAVQRELDNGAAERA